MYGSASSVSFSDVDVNGHATDRAGVVCLRSSGHAAPPVPRPHPSVTRQYNTAMCASVQCRKDTLISSGPESLCCSSRSAYPVPQTWQSAAPRVPSGHWPHYAIPPLHGEGASKYSRYRPCVNDATKGEMAIRSELSRNSLPSTAHRGALSTPSGGIQSNGGTLHHQPDRRGNIAQMYSLRIQRQYTRFQRR